MTATAALSGVHEAAARAEGFLLDAQDADGAWRDFLLPAGVSDAWVTAYAAAALVDALRGSGKAAAAARRGWSFLEANEAMTGGWSYNARVPADADSTLWGLRLAEALGEGGSPAARRATAFLDRHLRPDGGLATYAEAGPIRGYVGLPASAGFAGWTQSHVCVSAAGAALPRYAAVLACYLRPRQDPDGSWGAYFWSDREYATGEAVCAILRAPGAGPAVECATAWLTGRAAALAAADAGPRPAFALACAAEALARAARSDAARLAAVRAGEALAAWQRPSGSWGASARLRVPAPDAVVPDERAAWAPWTGRLPEGGTAAERLAATFGIFSPDHRGVFGAAAALRALRAVAGMDGR